MDKGRSIGSFKGTAAVPGGLVAQSSDKLSDLCSDCDEMLSRSLKYVSTVATSLILIFGFFALGSWIAGVPEILKAVLHSQFTLKANGALCLALLAISLLLFGEWRTDRSLRTVAYLCAFTVVTIGLLTLGEHLFGWELGIDQLISKESVQSAGFSVPGRMPPMVALSFVLIGLSLLTRDLEWCQLWKLGELGSILVATSALGSIIGYCYGVPPLDNAMSFTRTPLPMAMSLGVLSVSRLLSCPETWPMNIFVSRNVGGIAMRRLFPAVILVPVVIGGIRLAGEQARCYGHEFGSALVIVLMVAVLTVLLYWSARSLDRQDTARKLAQALLKNEQRTHFILENAPVGFLTANEEGTITDWNPEAENIFGLSRSEALGRSLREVIVFPEPEQGGEPDKGPSHMSEKRSADELQDLTGLKNDGQPFPIEAALFAVDLGGNRSLYAFVHDITERKEKEKNLLCITRELARSNAELQQFARVASHDLQEPLRVIQGYVELLCRRYQGRLDAKADKFIGQIEDATQRMGQLIEGVLAHSRIRGCQGSQCITDCNGVVNDAIQNLEISIRETGAEIHYEQLPTVAADRLELLQLFQNLISNAIKYRASEIPVIQISAEETESHWLFAVKDNGIGIETRYCDQIFDMFKRLHGKTDYCGTGIGLAICKKIAESHGGKIWVESEPEKGSTFFFTLPKSNVLAAPRQGSLSSL